MENVIKLTKGSIESMQNSRGSIPGNVFANAKIETIEVLSRNAQKEKKTLSLIVCENKQTNDPFSFPQCLLGGRNSAGKLLDAALPALRNSSQHRPPLAG